MRSRVRFGVVAAILLLSASAAAQSQPAVGSCLGGDCTLGAQVTASQDEGARRPTRGFARGAAWFGAVSAVLMLSGSIAIAAVDDPGSERITRGISLGYTALSVPLVALGSHTTRKRARVDGYRGIRILGWTGYAGALPQGVALWYGALRGIELPKVLTIGAGVMSLMAILPHAFDAYVASRRARNKGLARLVPGPQGFGVVF
jgi:hypothetical protein